MTPIIKIEYLSAGYEGKEVLHDINLTVYKDDYLGIIGSQRWWQDNPHAPYSGTDETHRRQHPLL